MTKPWRAGHAVVALEVACGVFVAGYLAYLGVTTGGVLPFVLAAAALLVVGVLAPRRWRRAGDESPVDRPPEVATTPAPPGPGRTPTLSERGRRDLERIVAVLADAGLLAPRAPDPRDLVEAVADAGEPVTVDTVLAALGEADHWHPGFRPDDHLGALAFAPWRGEQLTDTLRAQVTDLDRLLGRAMSVRVVDVALLDEGATARTRLTLALDGRRELLVYRGAHKALSTVVHVTVARALRDAAAPVRLAWLPCDQGVWIAALAGGLTVEGLNAELAITGPDRWEWVDEQEPLAAGEL